ncbi:MAG TPA: helix-turn-helix domain-containing protein [Puia sp.]|nr:helix-turn-helix domain-containing protein [Puia sp.]
MDQLSDILKSARNSKGFSQQYVADQLGISQRAYGFYEEGRRTPKWPKLKKIASILGLDQNEMLRMHAQILELDVTNSTAGEGGEEEPTAREILMEMARARTAHEKSYDTLARIIERQTSILELIKSDMARQSSLDDIKANLKDLAEGREDLEANVFAAIHRASERFLGTEDPDKVKIEIDKISRLAASYHAVNLKKGKLARRVR